MTNLLTGVIVNNDQLLSLAELSTRCSLPAERIIKMIDYGILEPQNTQLSYTQWKFSGKSLLRIQTTQRLRRDLGINLVGAALALDLLEEIKALRQAATTL